MKTDELLNDLQAIRKGLQNEIDEMELCEEDMTSEIRYNEGYIGAIDYITERLKEINNVRN